VLGLFVAQLYFDEDREFFFQCGCGGVEALSDLQGVDGVDGVEELGGAGGFVGLEGADEVKFGSVKCGEMLRFVLELLDAVLAEEALTGGVGFEDDPDRVDLADGHERNLMLGAFGSATGFGDLLVQVS